jgi:uncharacterized protein (DUF305 family)
MAPLVASSQRRSIFWELDVTVFSRVFVRRRVISLATTSSVTAVSHALAQEPKSAFHLPQGAKEAEEQQFLFANDLAMSNMNGDMLVPPTGDIDRDFADIMIPHHQATIDMAEAELKYGHDDQLRRLAEKIVAQQQQETSILNRTSGSAAAPGALAAEH